MQKSLGPLGPHFWSGQLDPWTDDDRHHHDDHIVQNDDHDHIVHE